MKVNLYNGFDNIFSVRLREQMKIHNVTQQDIANITQTTRQTIQQYYDGTSQPNISVLNLLANYFNVSADYLIGLSSSYATEQLKNENKRTYEFSEISNATGLSSMSVGFLTLFNKQPFSNYKNDVLMFFNNLIDVEINENFEPTEFGTAHFEEKQIINNLIKAKELTLNFYNYTQSTNEAIKKAAVSDKVAEEIRSQKNTSIKLIFTNEIFDKWQEEYKNYKMQLNYLLNEAKDNLIFFYYKNIAELTKRLEKEKDTIKFIGNSSYSFLLCEESKETKPIYELVNAKDNGITEDFDIIKETEDKLKKFEEERLKIDIPF